MLPPVPSLPPTSLWGHFLSCFKRENYARLSGRSSRREYWGFMLFCYLFTLVSVLLVPVGCIFGGLIGGGVGLALLLVFVLYSAMPALAVYVRRLHDVGWSGYWIALNYGITALTFGLCWFFFMSMMQEWLWDELGYYLSSPQSMYELVQVVQAEMPTSRWPWLRCLNVANNAFGFFLFVLTLWPGRKGSNSYGAEPL